MSVIRIAAAALILAGTITGWAVSGSAKTFKPAVPSLGMDAGTFGSASDGLTAEVVYGLETPGGPPTPGPTDPNGPSAG